MLYDNPTYNLILSIVLIACFTFLVIRVVRDTKKKNIRRTLEACAHVINYSNQGVSPLPVGNDLIVNEGCDSIRLSDDDPAMILASALNMALTKAINLGLPIRMQCLIENDQLVLLLKQTRIQLPTLPTIPINPAPSESESRDDITEMLPVGPRNFPIPIPAPPKDLVFVTRPPTANNPWPPEMGE